MAFNFILFVTILASAVVIKKPERGEHIGTNELFNEEVWVWSITSLFSSNILFEDLRAYPTCHVLPNFKPSHACNYLWQATTQDYFLQSN